MFWSWIPHYLYLASQTINSFFFVSMLFYLYLITSLTILEKILHNAIFLRQKLLQNVKQDSYLALSKMLTLLFYCKDLTLLYQKSNLFIHILGRFSSWFIRSHNSSIAEILVNCSKQYFTRQNSPYYKTAIQSFYGNFNH